MKQFGLVLCCQSAEDPILNLSFLRSLFGLVVLLIKGKIGRRVLKVSIYEDLVAHIVKIPYPGKRFEWMGKDRIKRIVLNYCRTQNIQKCVFANNTGWFCPRQTNASFQNIGKFLFKSLLYDVLNEIFSKAELKKTGLNISIIRGNSDDELITLIRLASPIAKYITVVSRDDKESIYSALYDIYAESGLAVSITDNCTSGFKSADIIIVLGNTREFSRSLRIKPGAIILNLSETQVSGIVGECMVINGIEVKLPDNIVSKLNRDMLKHFDATEIAEVILATKIGRETVEPFGFGSLDISREVSAQFVRDGYRIAGFRGCNSSLRLNDVRMFARRNLLPD